MIQLWSYIKRIFNCKSVFTVPEGDIIDRYSILQLRIEHGDEIAKNEIALYQTEVDKLINNERILFLYKELYHANASIWNLESNLRQGNLGNIPLEEVGKTALEIRNINRQRVAAKNAINQFFGRAIDHKIDHASQENNP